MINVHCPGCGASLRVGDAAAGKKGKCPRCGAAIAVPPGGEPGLVSHEPSTSGRKGETSRTQKRCFKCGSPLQANDGACSKCHAEQPTATSVAAGIATFSLLLFVGIWMLTIVGGAEDSSAGNGIHEQTNRASTPRHSSIDQRTSGNTSGHQLDSALPQYELLDEQVHDVPIKTQVQLDLLVSGEITEKGLRKLLADLYRQTATRTGFAHHSRPTHVFIYAYTDKARAASGMGQWIAMLSKVGESGQPEVSVNERQLATLGVVPKVRFGLTEQQRLSIWQDYILSVEDRANREAEERFPLEPEKAMKLGDELTLTKQTPLMPELEPTDPLESLDKIRRLDPGTIIRVKQRAEKGFAPWYEVDARSRAGRSIGTGWINSIALTGQSRTDMKEQLRKQGSLQSELLAKYKNEFLQRHDITGDQWSAISAEAIEGDWPFPNR